MNLNSNLSKVMQGITGKKLLLELVWFIFTAILAFGILAPIYIHTTGYPFYFINAFYIFIIITLFRYIFFLRFTFLEGRKTMKIILFFAIIPFTFYLIGELNGFREFLENMGNIEIMKGLDYETIGWLNPYMRREFFFSAVSAIILCIIFPFAMLRSIWKQVNNK